MRKKMVKNDLFYIHYPYRPDMENNVSEYGQRVVNSSYIFKLCIHMACSYRRFMCNNEC